MLVELFPFHLHKVELVLDTGLTIFTLRHSPFGFIFIRTLNFDHMVQFPQIRRYDNMSLLKRSELNVVDDFSLDDFPDCKL